MWIAALVLTLVGPVGPARPDPVIWDSACSALCAQADEPGGQGRCYYSHCLASNRNYDMHAVPGQDRQGKRPLGALGVNITIRVKLINNVNMDDESITGLMDIQMDWFDDGLQICRCGENKQETHHGEETFRLGSDAEDWMWTPDLIVGKYRSVERVAGLGTKRSSGLSVTSVPGSEHLGMRVTLGFMLHATVACNYDTRWFPFDKNYCVFQFGSSYNDNNAIIFKLGETVTLDEHTHHNGEFNITVADMTEDDQVNDTPKFSRIGFKAWVTRNGERVKTMYTYSMYFVMGCLALGSFAIHAEEPDPRQATDRLGFISGALLCATFLFQYSMQHSSSKVTPVTPVLQYLIACLATCLACLFQFVIVGNEGCVRAIITIYRKIVTFLRRVRGIEEEIEIENNGDEDEIKKKVEIQNSRDVLDIVSFVVFTVLFAVADAMIWKRAREN